MISRRRRREIIDALRRGTVPSHGLDALAVGLGRFETTLDAELHTVAQGGGIFKAIRGEYGAGKTFFAHWLVERAKHRGFATAEVQISETETPLHQLSTIYRRVIEQLSTAELPPSALREVLTGWFGVLESEAAAGDSAAQDPEHLLEARLATVSRTAPAFATAVRGYRAATLHGDVSQAEGILAWLGGQPHVAASVRRAIGVRGDLDHAGAFGFLQGLLAVLRDSDYAGLLLVLDEVETLQRARSDTRDKSLNALRQLIDEVDSGRFPGLYLLITGTPAFFTGTQGVQRLAPLAQRLETDFQTDPRFDNPRAVQIRLPGFSAESLRELGERTVDIYAGGAQNEDRIRAMVDAAYIADLADAVTGKLGGKVGVAPRIFCKKLVADVLDRVDQFPEFNPRRDYALTMSSSELTPAESEQLSMRTGSSAAGVDDVDLDV